MKKKPKKTVYRRVQLPRRTGSHLIQRLVDDEDEIWETVEIFDPSEKKKANLRLKELQS